VSVVGNTLHFTFAIPQGPEGAQGPTGNDGGDGPPGQPFAQAVVDGVNTLDPGMPVTVDVNFDGANVRFTFGLPRGIDGLPGADGASGSDGAPGEVSQADLVNAIQGTASNVNQVSPMALGISDPPQQWEVQQMADQRAGAHLKS
jgi:hypothetical protein